MEFSESGPSSKQPIRVLLVDDHPLVRRAFAAYLETSAGLQVVGQAANGAAALRLANELRPEVVLMDYNMPEMNGAAATRAILAVLPGTIVLGLSANDSDQVAKEMIEAGALAMLSKDHSSERILDSIYRAARPPAFLNNLAVAEHRCSLNTPDPKSRVRPFPKSAFIDAGSSV